MISPWFQTDGGVCVISTLQWFWFWCFTTAFVFVLLFWLCSYSFSPTLFGFQHCPLSSHTHCQFLYNISQNGWFCTMVRQPFGSVRWYANRLVLDVMVRKPFGSRRNGTQIVWFSARWCVNLHVLAWFVLFDLTCLVWLVFAYLVCCACFVWHCLEVRTLCLRLSPKVCCAFFYLCLFLLSIAFLDL